MEMTDKKKNQSPSQNLSGVWSGFISTTVIFMLLGAFLFEWAWWVFFIPCMTLVGAITTTINYYTTDTKKCITCGSRLDKNATFCRACGTKVLTECPSCNAKISNKASRFCEKCGKTLVVPQSEEVKTQNTEQNVQQPPVQRFIYCPACGSRVEVGSNVCPSCGMNL
jgi:predicted amidophosphoribosyltransferase